jgi:hypothetical protein
MDAGWVENAQSLRYSSINDVGAQVAQRASFVELADLCSLRNRFRDVPWIDVARQPSPCATSHVAYNWWLGARG